jgi:hypothetical protein
MPTYRTDPVTLHGMKPVYLLVCEQCEEELCIVANSAPTNGLTAADAALLWPDLSNAIAQHEDDCPKGT